LNFVTRTLPPYLYNSPAARLRHVFTFHLRDTLLVCFSSTDGVTSLHVIFDLLQRALCKCPTFQSPHLLGRLARVLSMAATNLNMEATSTEMGGQSMAELVVTLGRHIAQEMCTRITMPLAIMVTSLTSVGVRTILTPRVMIHPLIHGRAATSWQRGCLSHLSLGNTTMCEFLEIHLQRSPSFLFTSITLRPDSGFDMSERFTEPRGRMQPPREDYVYPHGSDPYRSAPPYIPRRESVHPGPGPINPYRPSYIDEGRWNNPYSLDDTSDSWAHQRSPSSTSRPPRGRLDYRDVSYEKSLSASPRSSRFSSPRHSRATASRRAYSPSSSSIRSSRERSKSPPRSREHSQSSVRPSADSRSCTAEPPVQPQVHRSHPVGQFRGRRRGGQRSGMRPPLEGFRGSAAPPFAPPLMYSNEVRPDDRPTTHPSLPLRPSPSYHEPGGRNHFSERGFSGPAQSRYSDSQASKGEIRSDPGFLMGADKWCREFV